MLGGKRWPKRPNQEKHEKEMLGMQEALRQQRPPRAEAVAGPSSVGGGRPQFARATRRWDYSKSNPLILKFQGWTRRVSETTIKTIVLAEAAKLAEFRHLEF